MLCDLSKWRIEHNEDAIPIDDEGKEKFEDGYLDEVNSRGQRFFVDEDGFRTHRVLDAMSRVEMVPNKIV